MDISSVFNPSSPEARSIYHLFLWVLALLGFILLTVSGLVGYISFRFRYRNPSGEPKPSFGNRKLEITWTIIPLLILAFVFYFTVQTMQTADPPSEGRVPDLIITGHQWWWEIRYPAAGATTANEIHIPVGKRLLVEILSNDVIHDFWVPQLARKVDAIPGQPNRLWIESEKAGRFLGFCAEYCGASHARMLILVIAESEGSFAAWLKNEATPARTAIPTDPTLRAGYEIFQSRTCVNCHRINGTAAKASIAPDLSHVGGRLTLAAGALTNTAANLEQWLGNPARFKPGAHMPDFHLAPSEIRGLAAYLGALR